MSDFSQRKRNDWKGRFDDVQSKNPMAATLLEKVLEGILALKEQAKVGLTDEQEKTIAEQVRKFKKDLIAKALKENGADPKAFAAVKAELKELTEQFASVETLVGIKFAPDGRGRKAKSTEAETADEAETVDEDEGEEEEENA